VVKGSRGDLKYKNLNPCLRQAGMNPRILNPFGRKPCIKNFMA
jgi:hypothetical protein